MKATDAETEEIYVPRRVDVEDLERARDERIGWCPQCEDFCVPDVAPDAFGIEHECGTERGCGWRHAIRYEFVRPTEVIDVSAAYHEELRA